jgi:ATP-dependent DNA ligase
VFLNGHRAPSSSASRLTAGASGFLNLSQSGERPEPFSAGVVTKWTPSVAFDLLELDGTDLRREPIEVRKALLR